MSDFDINLDMTLQNITNGTLTMREAIDRIVDYINQEPNKEYDIAIGTDSMTYSTTQFVLAITVHRLHNGGIFFYKITYLPLIKNLKKKLHEETNDSIQTTYELLDIIENNEEYEEILCSIPISIHVDLGNAGESRFVKSEIVGWITGLGLDYSIKPDSFVASTIADKISK